MIGTDAWTLDLPFWAMRQAFQETGYITHLGRPSRRHRARILPDREAGQPHLLPRPYGFKVACFPVKLEGGSAGWTRVVAMVEEETAQ